MPIPTDATCCHYDHRPDITALQPRLAKKSKIEYIHFYKDNSCTYDLRLKELGIPSAPPHISFIGLKLSCGEDSGTRSRRVVDLLRDDRVSRVAEVGITQRDDY